MPPLTTQEQDLVDEVAAETTFYGGVVVWITNATAELTAAAANATDLASLKAAVDASVASMKNTAAGVAAALPQNVPTP